MEVLADSNRGEGNEVKLKTLVFKTKEEDRRRFSKAWVGVLRTPSFGHGIQNSIEKEGFFGILVSSLGTKKCLIEECEDGALSVFMGEGEGWWKEWFVEVSKWSEEDIDVSRAVWLRVFGIPGLR